METLKGPGLLLMKEPKLFTWCCCSSWIRNAI